jgi:hypothetical protein
MDSSVTVGKGILTVAFGSTLICDSKQFFLINYRKVTFSFLATSRKPIKLEYKVLLQVSSPIFSSHSEASNHINRTKQDGDKVRAVQTSLHSDMRH